MSAINALFNLPLSIRCLRSAWLLSSLRYPLSTLICDVVTGKTRVRLWLLFKMRIVVISLLQIGAAAAEGEGPPVTRLGAFGFVILSRSRHMTTE